MRSAPHTCAERPCAPRWGFTALPRPLSPREPLTRQPHIFYAQHASPAPANSLGASKQHADPSTLFSLHSFARTPPTFPAGSRAQPSPWKGLLIGRTHLEVLPPRKGTLSCSVAGNYPSCWAPNPFSVSPPPYPPPPMLPLPSSFRPETLVTPPLGFNHGLLFSLITGTTLQKGQQRERSRFLGIIRWKDCEITSKLKCEA